MKTAAIENIAFLFLPQEALLPLLVMAGLLMIIGFRKAAASIGMFALGLVFLPVILDPLIEMLLNALPLWVVLLITVFVLLQVLRFFGELLFGREVWGQFFGSFLVWVAGTVFRTFGFTLRGILRMMRILLRGVFNA